MTFEGGDWAGKIFVEKASIYQPVLERGLKTAPAEARALSRIFRTYGIATEKKPFRILDVSCGIGRHSVNLAKLGYEVVGYDPSRRFLRSHTNRTRDGFEQRNYQIPVGKNK